MSAADVFVLPSRYEGLGPRAARGDGVRDSGDRSGGRRRPRGASTTRWARSFDRDDPDALADAMRDGARRVARRLRGRMPAARRGRTTSASWRRASWTRSRPRGARDERRLGRRIETVRGRGRASWANWPGPRRRSRSSCSARDSDPAGASVEDARSLPFADAAGVREPRAWPGTTASSSPAGSPAGRCSWRAGVFTCTRATPPTSSRCPMRAAAVARRPRHDRDERGGRDRPRRWPSATSCSSPTT